MRRRIALALVLSLASLARADWDLSGDFSTTLNPNGAWTFGKTDAGGNGFSPFAQKYNSGGLAHWGDGTVYPASYPTVVKNVSGTDVFWGQDVATAPGGVGFHPGPNGERAVIRWKAPESIRYRLVVSFQGLDQGTSVDWAVKYRTGKLSANLVGLNLADRVIQFDALAGDDLDLEVGSLGSFNSDTVGVSAHIAAVPEPASLAALGLGALGLLRRRRRA